MSRRCVRRTDDGIDRDLQRRRLREALAEILDHLPHLDFPKAKRLLEETVPQPKFEPPGSSWCGRQLDARDWYFLDAEHAALSAARGQYVLPCLECAAAIKAALDVDTEEVSEIAR